MHSSHSLLLLPTPSLWIDHHRRWGVALAAIVSFPFPWLDLFANSCPSFKLERYYRTFRLFKVRHHFFSFSLSLFSCSLTLFLSLAARVWITWEPLLLLNREHSGLWLLVNFFSACFQCGSHRGPSLFPFPALHTPQNIDLIPGDQPLLLPFTLHHFLLMNMISSSDKKCCFLLSLSLFSFFLIRLYTWASASGRKKALPISDLAIAKKYFRPQLVFRPAATTSHSLVSLTRTSQIYSRRDRRSQISQAVERNEFGLLFAIDVSIIRGERRDEGEHFAWLMMPHTVLGEAKKAGQHYYHRLRLQLMHVSYRPHLVNLCLPLFFLPLPASHCSSRCGLWHHYPFTGLSKNAKG